MTTTHTIRAEIEVLTPDAATDTAAYPTVDITFHYRPGCPERGPTYACGGTPAEPAEVDLTGARLVNGDGLVPTQEQVDDWASDWLEGVGYDRACDVATTRSD